MLPKIWKWDPKQDWVSASTKYQQGDKGHLWEIHYQLMKYLQSALKNTYFDFKGPSKCHFH